MRLLTPSRSAGAGLDEIEAVYRAGYASFVRVATAIAGDPDAGTDAVQEAFANAVRSRDDFRGRGWDDVLVRAKTGASPVRPARGRRRLTVVAIAAAAGALLATSAFGTGLVPFPFGTEGEPIPVEELGEWGLYGPGEAAAEAASLWPDARVEEAYVALVQDMPWGRIGVWAAPTEAGGWCTLPLYGVVGDLAVDEGLFGGCVREGGRPVRVAVVAVEFGDLERGETTTIVHLEGYVADPRIDAVAVVLANGATEEVRLADHWFVHEVRPDARPVSLVALDAGREVVRVGLARRVERVFAEAASAAPPP